MPEILLKDWNERISLEWPQSHAALTWNDYWEHVSFRPFACSVCCVLPSGVVLKLHWKWHLRDSPWKTLIQLEIVEKVSNNEWSWSLDRGSDGNEYSSLWCCFSRPPGSETPGYLLKTQVSAPSLLLPDPLVLVSWGWHSEICILNKFLG